MNFPETKVNSEQPSTYLPRPREGLESLPEMRLVSALWETGGPQNSTGGSSHSSSTRCPNPLPKQGSAFTGSPSQVLRADCQTMPRGWATSSRSEKLRLQWAFSEAHCTFRGGGKDRQVQRNRAPVSTPSPPPHMSVHGHSPSGHPDTRTPKLSQPGSCLFCTGQRRLSASQP